MTISLNCDVKIYYLKKLEICFEMLLADSEFVAFMVNYCDDNVE